MSRQLVLRLLEQILCGSGQVFRRWGGSRRRWCAAGFKMLAEVGARLVEHALGQRFQAIVGAAGGVVTAVAADMGGLAARQAARLAPVVRLAQTGPAVPTGADDLGARVHLVPSRGYSIHRTEGGVGGSSAKLSPLAAPTNWKRASGPVALGSKLR